MTAPKSSLPDGYKYWAFISYSHRDAKWANWLHKALETAIIPKNLVGISKNYGKIPSKLFPIFLDREELASSSSLPARIRDALKLSRYLIVVCSPAAARSYYVNLEISTFKGLGRENRVLALIVEGEPNKSNSRNDDCFPNALRYNLNSQGKLVEGHAEPIAADVRKDKDGKSDAILKLSAGILEVDFSDLKQRDRQRRLKRIRQYLLGVAIILMITIFGVTWWYSPQGQVWQAERDMLAMRKRISNPNPNPNPNPEAQAEAHGTLATLLISLGKSKDAQNLFASIDNPEQRALTIIKTAKMFVNNKKVFDAAKLYPSAVETIKTITDAKIRTKLFLVLAETTITNSTNLTSQFIELSLNSASEIKNPLFKAEALTVAADLALSIGNKTQASNLVNASRQFANAGTDVYKKNVALLNTARVAAKFGNASLLTQILDEAFESARKTDDRWWASYYSRPYETMKTAAELGNKTQVLHWVDRLEQFARKAKRPEEKAEILLHCAKIQATISEFLRAINLLNEARQVATTEVKIEDNAQDKFIVWNEVRVTVAKIVKESVDKQQVLNMLNLMPTRADDIFLGSNQFLADMNVIEKAKALSAAGARLKEADLMNEAYQIAKDINNNLIRDARSDAFETVVLDTVTFVTETKDTKLVDLALKAIDEITDNTKKASALFLLAKATSDAGDMGRALAFANKARNISQKQMDSGIDKKKADTFTLLELNMKSTNLIVEIGIQTQDIALLDAELQHATTSRLGL